MRPTETADVAGIAPALTNWVERHFGSAQVFRLPDLDPLRDGTRDVLRLARAVRGEGVALFPSVALDTLDGFFRLRLLQVLRHQLVLDALSVVVLHGAGGGPGSMFAERFRSFWPFARCVFLAESATQAAELAGRIGLPVVAIGDPAPTPVCPDPTVAPRIAVQVQPLWNRNASTTVFENQIESLVRAGYLTVRVFHEPRGRLGPTVASRFAELVPENAAHARAHVNGVAVPDGPWPRYFDMDEETGWAFQLAQSEASRIPDTLLRMAARSASVCIVNHLERVGFGLRVAPGSRLVLEAHYDRAAMERQRAAARGMLLEAVQQAAAAAERVQSALLGIPDLVVHATINDLRRLGRLSPRAALATPCPYVPAMAASEPAFEVLVAGDDDPDSVAGLRWFVESVWHRHLRPNGVRVAVAGPLAGTVEQPAGVSQPGLFLAAPDDSVEAWRARGVMTVVPDRTGNGVSLPLLTALAAGHPVATTKVGLRGLDPVVAAMLPGQVTALALAQEISTLLADPALLAARQEQVRTVYRRLREAGDRIALLAGVPVPDEDVRRSRMAVWQGLVSKAAPAERAGFRFTLENSFELNGGPDDAGVVLGCWQEPEPWGRWTDGAEACLKLTLQAPAAEPLRLELAITPPDVPTTLTVLVDGAALATVEPVSGPNVWDLPEALTDGKASLLLTLRVAQAFRPIDLGTYQDDRVLGIGIRSVALRSRQPSLVAVGQMVRLTAEQGLRNVLAAGWHPMEDWGAWTAARDAELVLAFADALSGAMRLALDLTPSPVGARLTVTINDLALPEIEPLVGLNHIPVPPALTEGQQSLCVRLSVPQVARPIDLGISADDRSLGIGVRAIGLIPDAGGVIEIGRALSLSAEQPMPHALLSGWHKQEDWGCWTSGTDALLYLVLRGQLRGRYRLEITLKPTPAMAMLQLIVGEIALPPIEPVLGLNTWSLPEEALQDRVALTLRLRVSETYCPMAAGASEDDRVLGVGVVSIGLFQEVAEGAWPVGPLLRINQAEGWRGIASVGWHELEDWGVWSAWSSAVVRLQFERPLASNAMLLMDLVPNGLGRMMTVVIEGAPLAPVRVFEGFNDWMLPASAAGKQALTIELIVDAMNPAGDADDRQVGIGLRAIGVKSFD